MTDDGQDPYRVLRKMFERMDPLMDIRKMFEELDPYKSTRELLKSIDPYYENKKISEKLETPKAIREAIKLLDPFREIYERLTPLPTEQTLQEAIEQENLNEEFNRLQENAKLLAQPIGAEAAKALLDDFQKAYATAGTDNLTQASSISIDAKIVLSGTGSMVTPVTSAESQQFVDVFRIVTRLTQQIKDPKSQRDILAYLFAIILFLLAPEWNHYYENHFILTNLNKSEKKQIIKERNSVVKSNIDQRATHKRYRYVKADTLRVRKKPNMSGEIIGYLHFAQEVEILDKRKNWALVKWTDETREVSIEGWTHTNHLKKYK